MLSDLSFNIPGPYGQRETLYNWAIYPFYGNEDIEKQLMLIRYGIKHIIEFI